MLFFKKKKCTLGTYRSGSKCVKNKLDSQRERINNSLECKSDGTSKYCGKDKPLKPAIAYLGGKTKLLPKIMPKIPKHEIYVEEFTGGGALFLKKPLAKKNVINDKNKDIVNVYKSFKNSNGFNKCDMKGSKNKFNRIKNKSKKSACDIVYLNKWSHGSSNKSYAINGNKKRSKAFKERWLKNKNKKDFGIKYQ